LNAIADAAVHVLTSHPDGLTVPRLVKAVKAAAGAGVSRAALERALVRDRRFRRTDVLGRPTWVVDHDAVASPAVSPVPDRGVAVGRHDPLAGLALRDWQVDAFAAWAAVGCVGVVEAVTGAGKTRLAIAAVRACLANGGRALVLVPTLDLLAQWRAELRALVPKPASGSSAAATPTTCTTTTSSSRRRSRRLGCRSICPTAPSGCSSPTRPIATARRRGARRSSPTFGCAWR
jgi:hypothetical protein